MSTTNNTLGTGWYDVPGRIATLLRWLDGRGEINSLDDAINVVEKPWHYEVEYAQMVREELDHAVTA